MEKAILVSYDFMTRLIVDENTTEEQINEMASKKIIERINNQEAGDNLLKIEDDDECPYGTFESDQNNESKIEQG